MSVIVQSSVAGLRPCAPTREKSRPVSLSCSPFRPRSGANGPRHTESATRGVHRFEISSVSASGWRLDQVAVSPGIQVRPVVLFTVEVGCPARSRSDFRDRSREILGGACCAGPTEPRGGRSRFAAHHWRRSPMSPAEDIGARPTHNAVAHSRAQRARKRAREKTAPSVFSRSVRGAARIGERINIQFSQ